MIGAPWGTPFRRIALPISPLSREASAERLLTVAPSPGTSNPWAGSGDWKTLAVAGTKSTATCSDGAAVAARLNAAATIAKATIVVNLLAFKGADSR
jgi:hypothetical protein